MTKNKESTRYFSTKHEESICKALGGKRTPNSGAGNFKKGDIIVSNADLLVEAKCSMSPKTSFSVKKEWLEKNKKEAFMNRNSNSCLCFNFEPDGSNYYVINEKLMKYLIECLSAENS